ncbi:MAG: hypothetical protein QM756_26760 [Polyangiaceae bacterium]
MRRDFVKSLLLTSLAIALPLPALAQTAPLNVPRIGLDAGEPLTRSAPPATPFGRAPATSKDSVLDFHGFILMPMNFALLKRDAPTDGQSSTALHTPPLIPEDETRFDRTGVIPTPWVQLNFNYGNSVVAATAVIVAKQATDAAGIFDATKQPGIADAFVSLNLSEKLKTPFIIRVGAFTGRYGAMGEYDAGRYGTPLIARTSTVGITTSVGADLGSGFGLAVEHGIGTSLARPGVGITSEGWNDFGWTGSQTTPGADPDAPKGVGTTLVNHLHGVLGYKSLVQVGLHYLGAWTQDEQVTPPGIQDGKITVLGADARLTLGPGGHLYAGVASVSASHAGTVSGVISLLNARGGPELKSEYLGAKSGGNGGLTIYGAQYDLSLARALYGDYFRGKSPDVRLSVFGMGVKVTSDDPTQDGVSKLKIGAEATYTLTSWFALSGRFDHAASDSSDPKKAFNVFSPRLLFHTDWMSRDQIAVQYSYYQSGDGVVVRTGFPPTPDPQVGPDKHVFSVSGTYWW